MTQYTNNNTFDRCEEKRPAQDFRPFSSICAGNAPPTLLAQSENGEMLHIDQTYDKMSPRTK
jgi:hypothetical protein